MTTSYCEKAVKRNQIREATHTRGKIARAFSRVMSRPADHARRRLSKSRGSSGVGSGGV